MQNKLKSLACTMMLLLFLPAALLSWQLFMMMSVTAASYVLSLALFIVLWLFLFAVTSGIIIGMGKGSKLMDDKNDKH